MRREGRRGEAIESRRRTSRRENRRRKGWVRREERERTRKKSGLCDFIYSQKLLLRDLVVLDIFGNNHFFIFIHSFFYGCIVFIPLEYTNFKSNKSTVATKFDYAIHDALS